MEQMSHHREGIQNELDKAYDEGHRDNEVFDEAQVKSEGETHISDEDIESQLSVEEKEISPELAETIARLKGAGYLDTSFEGKEFHRLEMRPLSKEEAIVEYKNSGGKTMVESRLEAFKPYAVPKTENLEVMMMNFKGGRGSESFIKEMNRLSVRPLTYEELIQYGIAHPSHQEQEVLVGLGSVHFGFSGDESAPMLCVSGDVRRLAAGVNADDWSGFSSLFPVVRK